MILALALALLGLGGADDAPESTEAPRSFLVPVRLPLQGDADSQIKRRIDQLLTGLPESPRPILVLEFQLESPGATGSHASAQGSEFERALSLARYLASERLSRVRTVAFLSQSVEGHGVLPVLACEEIVVHPDAEFGAAGIHEPAIDDTLRRTYSEMAQRRRTIPEPLVLGLLDPSQPVYRVQTSDGTRYVRGDELAELQLKTTVTDIKTVVQEGQWKRMRGSELRGDGFASHEARNRRELAIALKLPAGALEQSLLTNEGSVVRVDLRGRITPRLVNQSIQGLQEQSRRGPIASIVVYVDSPGGSVEESMNLANYLSEFDPSQTRTIAFVTEARGDAALPAFACDHLVMQKDATLGGPGDRVLRRSELADVKQAVQQLAKRKGRDWSLVYATVDATLSVQRFDRPGVADTHYFCDEELKEQEHPAEWHRGPEVPIQRGFSAEFAEQLRLTRRVVADFDELVSHYRWTSPPQPVQPAWLVNAIEQLGAKPWFARTLLFMAFFALVTEISTPTTGAAGFVSALCFLLFFWTQFLNGTADWLNVVLFIGGAGCLAIELFLLPGFGVFGVGGLLMMVVSIVLATQTFVIPRNPYQYDQFANSLFTVVAAGAGGVTAVLLLRRFLPNAPLFRRMMLPPPDEIEQAARERREQFADYAMYVGKRGVTTTTLTPAGKARFGDDVVPVISDGPLLPPRTDVVAVESRGTHLVVRSANG